MYSAVVHHDMRPGRVVRRMPSAPPIPSEIVSWFSLDSHEHLEY
jgi:hypothetical protein